MIFRCDSKTINIMLIALYVLYTFGTPSIIYSLPRFHDVYGVIQNINFIVVNKHSPLTGDFTYPGSYPGSLFLWASVHLVSSVPLIDIAKYYPIFLTFLLLLFIFIYCYTVLTKKYLSILGSISVLGLYWVQEYHFSPQSTALLIYSLALYSILGIIINKHSYKLLIIFILCSISLIISHALTPLYLLLNILAIVVGAKVVLKKNDIVQKFVLLIFLILITYLSWMFTVGLAFWKTLIFTGLKTWELIFLGNQKIQPYFALQRPTPDWALISMLRIYVTVVEILLALIIGGYFLYIKLKDNRNDFHTNIVILVFGLFTSNLVISFIGIGRENVLYIGRFLIYLPFSFSIMVVKFIESLPNSKLGYIFRTICIAYIIILVILLPVTRYSQDILEFIPESYISLNTFGNYYQIEPKIPSTYDIKTGYISDNVQYLLFSKPFYNYFTIAYQLGYKYKAMLANNNKLNAIYTTKDYIVYLFNSY